MTYVSAIAREHFKEQELELYWRFVAERQSIFARRTLGLDTPWTSDPILQVEFITNVYRKLDPGTMYLINNILADTASDIDEQEDAGELPTAADVVFNVMLYRVMGSVPETHEHLRFQRLDDWNQETFLARLAELPEDHRIFGDAYRVASYHDFGSDKKVDNVARLFEYLAGGMDETMRRIAAARRVVEVYKVFESMPGLGEFLAHQIVVDLLYRNHHGNRRVDFSEDEFAKAGPGARKGINTLLRDDINPSNRTIVMEWLRDNAEGEFARLDIKFNWLLDSQDEIVPMSLCDIQASLCEFHKYYRLWNGDKGVAVRRYTGPPTTPALPPGVSGVLGAVEGGDLWLANTENCWTYQKQDISAEEVAESTVEAQGVPSEVLDDEVEGTDPVQGALTKAQVRETLELAQDGRGATSTTFTVPGTDVVINITVNVYGGGGASDR